MPALKSFAIFGLGNIGCHILSALLQSPDANGLTIRILTRPGSQPPHSYPPNVTFHYIDYANAANAEMELTRVLAGVQVVISTVGAGCSDPARESLQLRAAGKHCGFMPGYANQAIVARAAKRAGCLLFLPAEFGSPTHTLDVNGDSFIRGKKLQQLDLMSMRLPYLLVYTGKFINPDPTRTPLRSNTTEMGNTPYPTTRHHAALFVVQVLRNMPLESLIWGAIMIRGQRREIMHGNRWLQFDGPSASDVLSYQLSQTSLS